MIYLLDTTTASDLSDEDPRTLRRITNLPALDDVAVSVITVGELSFGVERLPIGRRRAEIALRIHRTLARLTVFQVSEQAGFIFGQLKAHMRLIGRAIGDNDLWIAATALHLDATVVTRDRDFAAITALRREDWSL